MGAGLGSLAGVCGCCSDMKTPLLQELYSSPSAAAAAASVAAAAVAAAAGGE